jgi:EmrB/QacA subfamily drug resistance transporter
MHTSEAADGCQRRGFARRLESPRTLDKGDTWEIMTSRYQTHPYRWHGLAFIALSLLVASLNDTILGTSLPTIVRDLGSSTGEMQWIADAYLLVFASLLLTMGSLSDRYGRKRFLQAGVGLFGVFSILAGLVRSTELIIVARAAQGLAAAIIFPSTLSLITAMFPDGYERGRAIGIWSAMFGLGVGMGPLLGGWLVEHFHWSLAFFVNVPFALAAIVGGQIFLPRSRDETAPRPDIPGVVLSSVGLFALVFALIEAGSLGLTAPPVLAGFSIFVVMLAAFLWWEQRASNAMLPLYVFKNMSFTAANIALAFSLFTLIGVFFYIPQYLQGVLGYGPLEAAVRLLPQALLSVVFAILSATVVRWVGMKWAVAGGLAVGTFSLFLLSLVVQPHLSYWWLIGILILLCVGIDTALPAATMSVMGSVPSAKAGIGSAMNEMTGQVGGALGIAALGALLNGHYLREIVPLTSELSSEAYADVANSIFSAHQVGAELPAVLGQRVTAVADAAFSNGLSLALAVGAGVMLVITVITWVLLPSQIQPMREAERQQDTKGVAVEHVRL